MGKLQELANVLDQVAKLKRCRLCSCILTEARKTPRWPATCRACMSAKLAEKYASLNEAPDYRVEDKQKGQKHAIERHRERKLREE